MVDERKSCFCVIDSPLTDSVSNKQTVMAERQVLIGTNITDTRRWLFSARRQKRQRQRNTALLLSLIDAAQTQISASSTSCFIVYSVPQEISFAEKLCVLSSNEHKRKTTTGHSADDSYGNCFDF